uniref:AlNc14C132G7002 protein n=1 Tax=Albugo laibachii Nc14 TaxID=890382 RepID=F0WKF0_9STRA|nr:AlNc14C132G7002 [Albugo laibachii Nc14]|eukprot:CCA21754.1 AlNc14C132G7002 [Albugo laibachii Nc14]
MTTLEQSWSKWDIERQKLHLMKSLTFVHQLCGIYPIAEDDTAMPRAYLQPANLVMAQHSKGMQEQNGEFIEIKLFQSHVYSEPSSSSSITLLAAKRPGLSSYKSTVYI